MKPYILTIFIYILLLVACTPTTTSTPVAILPTDIPTDIPTQIPTPIPSDTPTSIPLPQVEGIIVTSASDSGPGTLRQALQDAQDYDTITFDPAVFPPDAPATINVSSELPHIRVGNLTLDASDAGVILDGSQIPGEWVAGLQIVSSEGNTIMGLQIAYFPGPGIAISGDSTNNVIGGDRGIGISPFGQGNLFSNNEIGIDLSANGTTLNTVTGNLIGTDGLSNDRSGITISEGAHGNTIGPDNVIAFNGRCGVFIGGNQAIRNRITQNNFVNNGDAGICVGPENDEKLQSPNLSSFEFESGSVSGSSCAGCIIEIFSAHDGEEGTVYEGQVTADSDGFFSYTMGEAFTKETVTVTASDDKGNTSNFSHPAGIIEVEGIDLQAGNTLPKYLVMTRPSWQLVSDSRLGIRFNETPNIGLKHWEFHFAELTDLGIKRVDTTTQELEPPIYWNFDEMDISPDFEHWIDALNANGIAINYLLHYWDKEGHNNGEALEVPRFQSEEQIQDFLDYTRKVVGHFKGRIQYYTIWTEPGACGGTGIKCIEPYDYIQLARQIIPVIHQEDPEAKVVLGPPVLYFNREFITTVMSSDVAPMFDVVFWHGIYDPIPGNEFYGDYYYEYPLIIEEIKQVANENGFEGEYWGTDMSYCYGVDLGCHDVEGHPWEILETEKLSAKYSARLAVIQLGLDVGLGWDTVLGSHQPWIWPTVRNLYTIMAGTVPINLAVGINSPAENIASYSFTLPNGDKLFAFWTDGVAVEDHPGVNTTLTFRDLDAGKIVGLDVLYGFEQELVTEAENGDLVISNLLIKDYPIIIKFIDTAAP